MLSSCLFVIFSILKMISSRSFLFFLEGHFSTAETVGIWSKNSWQHLENCQSWHHNRLWWYHSYDKHTNILDVVFTSVKPIDLFPCVNDVFTEFEGLQRTKFFLTQESKNPNVFPVKTFLFFHFTKKFLYLRDEQSKGKRSYYFGN